MSYLVVLLHVAICAFVGGFLGGISGSEVIAVIVACTGAIIGAMMGTARWIVMEMRKPELTRQALYPRVLRDLDDDEVDRSKESDPPRDGFSRK